MSLFWWMTIGILLSCAGEAASKQWADSGRWTFFALAVVTYTSSQFPWYVALKQKNHLATLGTVWCLAGVVGAVVIGRVLFGEDVTTSQWIGIALALVACVLLA